MTAAVSGLTRMSGSCAIPAIVASILALPSWGADAPTQQCPRESGTATDGAPKEAWLAQELRRFRSYPHLDRAYRLMREGKLEEATAEIAGYLRIEPRDAVARESYVVLLYQQGKYSQTACEATLLVQEHPGSESALTYRALARVHLGRRTEALPDFLAVAADVNASRERRVFAVSSAVDLLVDAGKITDAWSALKGITFETNDFGYYFRKGSVAEDLGYPAEAEKAYDKAIKTARGEPERGKALVAAGAVALRTGQWQQARDLLHSARQLQPRNLELLRMLAQADQHLGDYEEANELINAVLSNAPSRHDHQVAAELSLLRKDWQRAADEYAALLADPAPGDDRYRIAMSQAQAYEELGQHANAAAALRKALSLQSTPQALLALATELELAGQYAEAKQILEQLAAAHPGPEMHARIAILDEKLGNPSAAIAHLQDALRLGDNAKLHEQLAYLLAARGDYARAAEELQHAMPAKGAGVRHLRIAELYEKAGDRARELEQLNLAAADALDAESRQYVERQRGFLYSQLGDNERSIVSWKAAVEAGLDNAAIHMDLGFALLEKKHWDEARGEFLRSTEHERSPSALYYVALCYKALGQPGIAADYLELAARDAERLDVNMRKTLYDELGFDLRADGREREAAAAWRNSMQIRYDATIALELAMTQRHIGNTEEAKKIAGAIPAQELSVAQRVLRAEVLAEVLETQHQFSAARSALLEADEQQPTAKRAYRRGLLAEQAGNDPEAVDDFETAVAREPDNLLYAESLVYAYRRIGQPEKAAGLLEAIVARNPKRVATYRELAYTQLSLGHQAEAASLLRQAIDARLAETTQTADESPAEDLSAMRTEYATLARRFQATFYESYRPSSHGQPAGGDVTGGIIPSEGGTEVAYFPADMFHRTDDPLQFTARLLWSSAASGDLIDHQTLQAGLSVRYKPLTHADLFIGAERLFKIGSNSLSEWLLRASLGLGHEVEPQAQKIRWNYWQLYFDAGYFIESRTEATYVEFRRGLTLPTGTRFSITPHIVLVDRHQSPDPSRTSIFEGGPGLLFRYLFPGTPYVNHGPTADLLLQYRARFSGRGHGDWVLTGVLRF